VLGDGLQYGPRIAPRIRNRAENLARRGQLVRRLDELSRSRLELCR
jgi:hypothetical protein